MDVIGNIRKVIAFVFRAGAFTVTIKADDTPALSPKKNITLNVVDGDSIQTIVSDSSANTLTNKTINSDSNTLTIDTADANITINADDAKATITNIDSDNIKDGGIETIDIADDAITNSKIATDAVTSDSIQAGAVGTDEIADDAVTAAKINADLAGEGLTQAAGGELDVNVDDSTIEINADVVRVKASGIDTNELADGSVTGAKLDPAVAGLGIVQGVSDQLDVNVDDSTIEIDTDVVRVKDLGITTAKLENDAVDSSKLADDAVDTDAIQALAVTDAKINDVEASKITGSFPELYLEEQTATEAGGILAAPANSVHIRITSSSGTLSTISGLAAERYIQLENATGSAIFITDTSSVGNIQTGTKATLELADEATIVIYYDGSSAKIIGGSGGSGGAGGISTQFYTHTALPTPLVKNIRYIVDISAGNATSTMPAIDLTNDGSVIEVWPVNSGLTGNTITLTAGGSDEFNDPDLGVSTDQEYVQDVGRSRYVADDTANQWHIGDSYWSAGIELAEATATQAGTVKVAYAASEGNSDSITLSNTGTPITFTLTDVSGFTPTTGTFTAISVDEPGIYEITTKIMLSVGSSAVGSRISGSLQVNATTVAASIEYTLEPVESFAQIRMSKIVNLSASDNIRVVLTDSDNVGNMKVYDGGSAEVYRNLDIKRIG